MHMGREKNYTKGWFVAPDTGAHRPFSLPGAPSLFRPYTHCCASYASSCQNEQPQMGKKLKQKKTNPFPSHSIQTSLYEDLLSTTITTTQSIPSTIARTGRINLTRREINMQIGELFILRINIHLQGSVLDAPELMWAEPQLEPVYQAVRSYLEMDQRVELMQERVSVVGDLLAVLKDQLSHTHGMFFFNPLLIPFPPLAKPKGKKKETNGLT